MTPALPRLLTAAVVSALVAGAAAASPRPGRTGGISPMAAMGGQPVTFSAKINAAQETPTNSSTAKGDAVLVIHKSKKKAFLTVVLSKPITDLVVAHLHMAPRGEPGPVVVGVYQISEPLGKEKGLVFQTTITDDQLEATGGMAALIDSLKGGNIYINLHTAAFPGGEIRGQFKQTAGEK
jgi:hypothetical protein